VSNYFDHLLSVLTAAINVNWRTFHKNVHDDLLNSKILERESARNSLVDTGVALNATVAINSFP